MKKRKNGQKLQDLVNISKRLYYLYKGITDAPYRRHMPLVWNIENAR
jgi:hypothetical protein